MTENKTVAKNGDCFAYGDSGTRTRDLCVANASLSQLSYIPKMLDFSCEIIYLLAFEDFSIYCYFPFSPFINYILPFWLW